MRIELCKYRSVEDDGVATCRLGRFGGRPSEGVCRHCLETGADRSRGLGDTVAKAIQAVTLGAVKPCGGCKARQSALNRMMPYREAAGGD